MKVTERSKFPLEAVRKILTFKLGGIWHFWATDIDGRIADQSMKAEGID